MIFEEPAAQAPPPPVRAKPAGHMAVAQVLGTPPASVQLVEPELETSTQFIPCGVAQVGGVPRALLSSNTIEGSADNASFAGVPTKDKLFDSPVKL